MKALILVSLLALAGCCTPPKPQPPVSVPVPVACVKDVPPRPPLVTDGDLKAMSDYQMALALWRDRMQREGYEGELVAVIEGCRR